jgi:hypothetical protein
MKKCLFLLLFSLIFATLARAEPVSQKAKLWTSIDFKGTFAENFQYYLEPQLRLISRSQCFEEANLYVGLGYPLSKQMTFWVGNLFNTTHKVDDGDTFQYRIWEQLSWEVFDGHFIHIDSRTRLEQRKQEYQTDWALRFREKVSFSFPLNRCGFFFVLADEVFLNGNHPSWVYHSLFNQNRAFVGFLIPIAKTIQLETGYLNQYVAGTRYQLNHVLSFVLRVKNK